MQEDQATAISCTGYIMQFHFWIVTVRVVKEDDEDGGHRKGKNKKGIKRK